MIKASTQKASRDFNETLAGPFVDCKKDNNSNSPTTCCLQGQYCDVDLLCHEYGTGVLSRQYCSDPGWPEGSCSEVCPGEQHPPPPPPPPFKTGCVAGPALGWVGLY